MSVVFFATFATFAFDSYGRTVTCDPRDRRTSVQWFKDTRHREVKVRSSSAFVERPGHDRHTAHQHEWNDWRRISLVLCVCHQCGPYG
jgi:hypothetical protein